MHQLRALREVSTEPICKPLEPGMKKKVITYTYPLISTIIFILLGNKRQTK